MGDLGKAAIAVVLLAAAGGLAYRGCPGGALPPRASFVCVETGKTYTVKISTVVAFPARNPDTGQDTLLPCKLVDGRMMVDEHYRPLIRDLNQRGVCKHVDPQTLEVRAP